jgi:pimeloyl-ACP methyl ester carboxylesterase
MHPLRGCPIIFYEPATPDHEGRNGQVTRSIFFDDPLFEEFALRPLIIDGCPLGEISATTSLIEEGDHDGWYRQWIVTAERVAGYADESVHAGHTISARDAYLRASSYYRAAYLPLYGSPVDPRLVEAFDKETDTFQKAAALMAPPVEPVEIPYEGTTLPGYFCQADDTGRPRPTLIVTNGYDSTINEVYLDSAAAALPRGYNLLLYDGPGQGRVLIKQGLVMRPDWENVVGPVVDYALTRTEVDPEKIAIMGISLGGYLAPRAASSEHRLAACIADPGSWDMLEAMKARFSALPKDVLEKFPNVGPEVLEPFEEHIRATPALRWNIIQRAFWVHGVDSLSEYLHIAEDYSLKEVVSQTRCPTLLTWAESDPLSWDADRIYEQLSSPKEMVRFYDAEGAGDHCEAKARSLFHQRAFDWLDETLEVSPKR